MKLSQPAGCWLTVPDSKSSVKKLPPVPELLLEELDEEELELLLEELDEEELELLLVVLPEEEELELLELEELEELLEVGSSPTQAGAIKVPS